MNFKLSYCLLLITIFMVTISEASGSKTIRLPCGNGTCVSPQGICNKVKDIEQCLCDRFFSGPDCNTPWKEIDSRYLKFYIGANVFTSICDVILIIIGIASLKVSISNRIIQLRKWNDWNLKKDLSFLISSLLIFGAFMKILYMAIDPQNYGETYDFIGGLIFFNIPQFTWSTAFVLMVLLWLQVVESTKHIRHSGFYIGAFMKKFFFIFFFINLIFGFALVLLDAFVKLIPGLLLYNIYIVILMLFLSSFQLIGGSIYVNLLRGIMKKSENASIEVEKQAKKVHIAFICMSIPMYMLILDVGIMNEAFDFTVAPLLYIVYRVLADLFAHLGVLFAFWAIHKKSIQKTSSTASTESNSSASEINGSKKSFGSFFKSKPSKTTSDSKHGSQIELPKIDTNVDINADIDLKRVSNTSENIV